VSRNRIASILVAAVWLWDAPTTRAGGDENPKTQEAAPSAAPGKLVVTVGKSLIIDSPMKIQRISVANGDLIEAVAVNPKEVLINGKAAGETSLIIWQEGGNRLLYDLTVRLSPMRLDAVRQQLARDFPNEDINVTYENETAFVRGTVKDVIAAERVMAITASLGKMVNLLRVEVPPVEEQILLKVRFCNVDRGASTELGVSFASGAFNQTTVVGTGQFSGPKRSAFCCSAETSTWRHPLRRWKASASWKPSPSQMSWRSTARKPASWRAASFRFR
jgi:Flp pilus assembly secretin CpaC